MEKIRGREKIMRTLKRPDTPIRSGHQIFHNYVQPLDGRTPEDLTGIQVEGENKWLTLILQKNY
jgi:hypothetical protein